VPVRSQLLVYLVGMVGLNLPHGGYEHFRNLRHRGLPFGTRYVAIYIIAVAGFVGLFLFRPVLAPGVAFATAVAKGGHGDSTWWMRSSVAATSTTEASVRSLRWSAAVQ